MSKLYIVATPIGNMQDMTFRAIDALKNADLVLCEDTRVTGKLFARYEIQTKKQSFHAQSSDAKIEQILETLREGKSLALVTDAGTPGVSDPGTFLINKIHEELNDEVEIIPIPGASALTVTLSVCPLAVNEFTFLGFLPHKKGRETLFKEITESKRAFVFYESPHRILKTLESLTSHCSNKKVFIAREITKLHEEFKLGLAAELLEYYREHTEKVRGEFTVVVSD